MKRDSPWLTTREAADILRIRPITLYRLVKKGKLELHPLKVGRVWRFDQKEIDNLLAPKEGRHRGS
jgi:excisionase family DNA binding protein